MVVVSPLEAFRHGVWNRLVSALCPFLFFWPKFRHIDIPNPSYCIQARTCVYRRGVRSCTYPYYALVICRIVAVMSQERNESRAQFPTSQTGRGFSLGVHYIMKVAHATEPLFHEIPSLTLIRYDIVIQMC
jgi:hypothetical protein